MGFSARSVVALAVVLCSAVAPAIAAAQGAGAGTAPPPPGGGAAAPAPAPAPAGSGTAPGTPAPDAKRGEVGGFTFTDKPGRRGPAPATARRVVRRTTGPLATFPGFEQLPDGGSRLFVQLSQAVPVEERRAQGSVTYVLKGAHLRVHNDSNALVTVHFNTPVFRARLTPSGSDLLFVLELRSAATPTFKVQENKDKTSTLMIDFPKGEFITGDGSETLPGEQRPGKGTKRPPTKGAPGGRQAPPDPGSGSDDANGNGNTGPTP